MHNAYTTQNLVEIWPVVTLVEELSIKEAATVLGVHPDTIKRWIKDGKIVAEKRGKGRGKYYVPAATIDSFRTTKEITERPREIDATAITKEIYEQRDAVIRLCELISEMRASEISTGDQVQYMSAKLEELTAKIDALTPKLKPLDRGATDAEVKYREHRWQFWRHEKPRNLWDRLKS